MDKQKNDEKEKKFKVTFSLKLKFTLAIITITVAVISSMAVYFLDQESKLLTENIITNALVMTENFSAIASSNMGAGELAIFDAIETMSKNKSFSYAYVTDAKGAIVVTLKPELAGTVLQDSHFMQVMLGNKKSGIEQAIIVDPEDNTGVIYDFISPINSRMSEERIGIIRLGFSDAEVRKQIKQLKNTIFLIALVFIAISIAAALLLSFITTKPLKLLSQGVAIIATGNMDHQINVNSLDEIGRLAEEFNFMTSELKNAKEKEIENRLMEEQLELAKEIQEGLNPMGYYNKGGIQIKGYTRAAKGVGGDYFDYIDIGDSRVGALISDVSGKGVPASLVMVMIRTVFVTAVNQSSGELECKKIVTAINDSLSADFAIDKFATLFFLIYDRETEQLEFTNAGHGPLFLYRADKQTCTVTSIEGMPIGIMDEAEYLQAKVAFRVGDIVVLYTDGITEMRNSQREEYGRTKLQKLILNNSTLNAEELVNKIVDDVDSFRGETPPHDDMTVLIVKRGE